MNSVKIERKQLSNGLEAVLVDDGMTVAEIVRVLGIPQQTVSDHMKTKGFSAHRKTGKQLRQLQDEKVVPIAARAIGVYPQAAIESLVRFVSNPATDALYAELWSVAKASNAGLPMQVTPATVLAVIQHLQAQVDAETARANQEHHLRLVEETAHSVTKAVLETAKIGPEQIAIVKDLIKRVAYNFRSVVQGWSYPRNIGCVQRAVKARWGSGKRDSTFKDIARTDFDAAVLWLKRMTPEQYEESLEFVDTDHGLQDLRERLVALETTSLSSASASQPAP